MKYSLRNLLIVAIVGPPLLAGAIWLLIPHAATRGSPAAMAAFLRVVKEPYPSKIAEATEKCFVVGAPASRYKAVLGKADRRGVPDIYIPFTRTMPTGTQYVFWCEGKAPGSEAHEGDAFVVVVIDGKPPKITYAWWDFLSK